MKRRILSIILAAALLAAMAVPAAAAGSSLTPFSDVSDAETAESVEVLRMLGVVDGMSATKFEPYGKLTRAQFCKMAIVALGKGDSEPSYRTRTIFSDVTASHWARGYINLAATGEGAIISGMGNGLFSPDTNITWAQALTILVRILGYTDADTDMQWPEGYINLASGIGLTQGISVSANSAINRGEAAKLFRRLLDCTAKTGAAFASSFGAVTENVILLNTDARAADGTAGAAATSIGTFKPVRQVSSGFVGLRGSAVINSSGKLAAFIPNSGDSAAITTGGVEAAWVKDSAGKRYSIPGSTPAYTADEATTWSELWLTIPTGAGLTLYFSANGTVEAVFFRAASTETNTAVADAEVKGNPFTSILNGAASYEVYKNGEPASLSDVRDWDVGEYDSVARRLNLNDFKLTGCYENAYPGPASPEKITLMGHTFSVLPSAQAYLEKLALGSNITLLLTSDLRVAGAVPASVARGNGVGIVTEFTPGSQKAKAKGSVSLLTPNGVSVVLTGEILTGDYSKIVGELVSVSGSQKGVLSVFPLAYSDGVTGTLDLESKTLGSAPLSASVRIFDRKGTSALAETSLSLIPQATINKRDIVYAHTNWAGKVDIIILNDITGDCYTYGRLNTNTDSEGVRSVWVTTPSSTTGAVSFSNVGISVGFCGLCYSADGKQILAHQTLTKVRNVPRSAFYKDGENIYCDIDGVKWPVAENVGCYHDASDPWFDTLDEARAFSASLTVYYDRAAEEGGKIRIVAVE